MKPLRVEKVNGNTIEEFYWAGKLVVYVNNRLFNGDFEAAIKNIIKE
jgi:hypothetical protein